MSKKNVAPKTIETPATVAVEASSPVKTSKKAAKVVTLDPNDADPGAVEGETKEEAAARRGRPTNPDSARQAKLAGFQAKIDQGIELKRGRPANENSARQQRLAERAARIAAGASGKPGRPKMVKVETTEVVAEVPTTEAVEVEVQEQVAI